MSMLAPSKLWSDKQKQVFIINQPSICRKPVNSRVCALHLSFANWQFGHLPTSLHLLLVRRWLCFLNVASFSVLHRRVASVFHEAENRAAPVFDRQLRFVVSHPNSNCWFEEKFAAAHFYSFFFKLCENILGDKKNVSNKWRNWPG